MAEYPPSLATHMAWSRGTARACSAGGRAITMDGIALACAACIGLSVPFQFLPALMPLIVKLREGRTVASAAVDARRVGLACGVRHAHGAGAVSRRVAITGIGLVTAIGLSREETWANLIRGTCGIRPLTLFDKEGYRSQIAAEVEHDRLAAAVYPAPAPPLVARRSLRGARRHGSARRFRHHGAGAGSHTYRRRAGRGHRRPASHRALSSRRC